MPKHTKHITKKVIKFVLSVRKKVVECVSKKHIECVPQVSKKTLLKGVQPTNYQL